MIIYYILLVYYNFMLSYYEYVGNSHEHLGLKQSEQLLYKYLGKIFVFYFLWQQKSISIYYSIYEYLKHLIYFRVKLVIIRIPLRTKTSSLQYMRSTLFQILFLSKFLIAPYSFKTKTLSCFKFHELTQFQFRV